ncbi:hypothetical protein ACM40_06775 [Chryseobacterium sp. BLS98]|jgi:hypothetical protein|uniref:hypothetical protein n=1 Tax=Chryseobacterium sp. BLS98 TaxID=885586 RepID=UPI00065AFE7D|nr:hypothetical protein [Chryseobacterium sp. BLS98]KMQ62014.1 hypothetical protein ACM40_06775 [Chryseobacterium sp. BLS98]
MKKKFYAATFLVAGATMAYSQVGINNISPKSTLDITAKTTDGSSPEGIIAPRLTGDQIKAGDTKYTTAQIGAIVYATSAVGASTPKTINITAAGYYYFDGLVWQKISTGYITVAKNVTTEQTGSYTALSTDDIILLAPSANGFTLTLPTTGIPIGKTYYINNKTSFGVTLSPLPTRDIAYSQTIDPQGSKVLMYIGGTGDGSYINLTEF